MNIIDIATQAGLQVLLDARIGSQTYHSVCGSLSALQRFADAISTATTQALESNERVKRRSTRPRPAAASHARRSRRRVALCGRGAVIRERAQAIPR
jgi:hypothetical protein